MARCPPMAALAAVGSQVHCMLQESRRFEHQISRLSVTSRDCAVLMPGEQPTEQARVEALQDEQKVLEEELVEAEAKNRLYSLLGERTRCA